MHPTLIFYIGKQPHCWALAWRVLPFRVDHGCDGIFNLHSIVVTSIFPWFVCCCCCSLLVLPQDPKGNILGPADGWPPVEVRGGRFFYEWMPPDLSVSLAREDSGCRYQQSCQMRPLAVSEFSSSCSSISELGRSHGPMGSKTHPWFSYISSPDATSVDPMTVAHQRKEHAEKEKFFSGYLLVARPHTDALCLWDQFTQYRKGLPGDLEDKTDGGGVLRLPFCFGGSESNASGLVSFPWFTVVFHERGTKSSGAQ